MGTHNPVHADTMDGTMCAFALMCTKVQTPIFPAATFERSTLERFVAESAGKEPGVVNRPPEIHTRTITPPRAAREGCLVMLPPCVAHSIPNNSEKIETSGSVSEYGTQLSAPGDARWFCRVSIEVVPKGPTVEDAWGQWRQPWPAAMGGEDTRKRVALLTARYVWGDAEFSKCARQMMELDDKW